MDNSSPPPPTCRLKRPNFRGKCPRQTWISCCNELHDKHTYISNGKIAWVPFCECLFVPENSDAMVERRLYTITIYKTTRQNKYRFNVDHRPAILQYPSEVYVYRTTSLYIYIHFYTHNLIHQRTTTLSMLHVWLFLCTYYLNHNHYMQTLIYIFQINTLKTSHCIIYYPNNLTNNNKIFLFIYQTLHLKIFEFKNIFFYLFNYI